MSNRMFQSVVLQMKESTDRVIGVIDEDGIVIACNDLPCIGENWSGVVQTINGARDEVAVAAGKTFKPLSGWSAQFDYAVFVTGEDEQAKLICSMAAERVRPVPLSPAPGLSPSGPAAAASVRRTPPGA